MASSILEKERDLLDKLSDVLVEREVIEGAQLRRYVDGEEPIPTRDELKAEAEQKASENGQTDQQRLDSGPAIIASGVAEEAGDQVTTELPARPDH